MLRYGFWKMIWKPILMMATETTINTHLLIHCVQEVIELLILDRWFNSLRKSDAYMHQETNNHWFRWWLVTCSTPSHYLKQHWNIVNSSLRNKLQWNLKWTAYIFIQENAFVSVISEMAIILCWPQRVRESNAYTNVVQIMTFCLMVLSLSPRHIINQTNRNSFD